jgi:hypothetical protein
VQKNAKNYNKQQEIKTSEISGEKQKAKITTPPKNRNLEKK